MVEGRVGTRCGGAGGQGPCACPGQEKRAGTVDKHKTPSSTPHCTLSLRKWQGSAFQLIERLRYGNNSTRTLFTTLLRYSTASRNCLSLPAYPVLSYALPLLRFQYIRGYAAVARAVCARFAHRNSASGRVGTAR